MLNRIRQAIAKLIGYQQMLAEAFKVIGLLNDEATKYQKQAADLRRQLETQRAELREEIAELEQRAKHNADHFEEAYKTGLYELIRAEDYGSDRDFLRPLTHRMASQAIDTSDCQPCGPIFYLKDGTLVPVTLGEQFRAEPDERGEIPFEYAYSDIYAAGEVVGQVTHTDH